MKKLSVAALLMTGIVLVVNLLAAEFNWQLDLTDDQEFTLSDATKTILDELEEPVTIQAYFTENLPPDLARLRKRVENTLKEYAALSNKMLVYDLQDPNADESIEKEAINNGVRPLMVQSREKDQQVDRKAYLGAVISIGEQKEVIPVIDPNGSLEYELTTAIKKIAVLDKPKIGFVQGHGEPPLTEMSEVATALSVLYDVVPVVISDSTTIPQPMEALVMVRPTQQVSPVQIAQLEQFMVNGGNLLVALNTVSADLNAAGGGAINTGVDEWLGQKGIQVNKDFVIDVNCNSLTSMVQGIPQRFRFPFLPVMSNFNSHQITAGLEGVIFDFVSSIQFTGDTSQVNYEPLVFSSEQAGTRPAPQRFNYGYEWQAADFTEAHIPVAGLLKGKLAGDSINRLVVIADGDFAVNGTRENFRQQPENNISLLVNSIDWLADDTGLIALRDRTTNYRPLDEIEESERTQIKYFNFFLPILLVLLYGVYRAQWRKRQRNKRKEERYD